MQPSTSTQRQTEEEEKLEAPRTPAQTTTTQHGENEQPPRRMRSLADIYDTCNFATMELEISKQKV